MSDFHYVFQIKRRVCILLMAILSMALIIPVSARAQENTESGESGKKIRVGWYETPFNRTDQYGRRSGYAYEYQRKLAAYTGWEYEYVEGSWHDLLEMLKRGEIDLMSDVSYMEERADDMLYASLPMGTEAYYVFISPDNTEILSEDLTTLNGKKVGVTDGSIQKDLFLDWANAHDIEVEVVDLTCSEEASLQMLKDGEIDAFITLDTYGDPDLAVPVCKIGASDFYFVVNKDRPDLLNELDAALNRIQDENKHYNQQLHEKCLSNPTIDKYLTPAEKEWLSDHGPIRVGYQDNYLAFCAADKTTGELTGALKDYLALASTCLENARPAFEPVAFPTAADAMEALKKGEVDCVFPANLTDYDSETLGVVMSPALMRTEMDAVVRGAESREFVRKDNVIVAVNEGNTNYDMFLADHYPTWDRAYYKDTPTALEAVAAGDADCVIISNYRFSNISKLCEKLHLNTVYTGVDMDYCFAVNEGNSVLYSILSRIANAVPDATVHSALTYYSTEDVKTSFADLIKDNLFIVMTVIAIVLLIILILLLRSIRAEKKAIEEHKKVIEEHHLVDDLNKKVYVDPLTSVRNKGAYADYMQELQDKLDNGEEMTLAIGILDCDNLKAINDGYGHDKGDEYLKAASRLICQTFQHSPVFRIGGDEFAVILKNDDYQNREQLVETFSRKSEEICSSAENGWDEVHVAIGIAEYDPRIDESLSDTARRADKIMYENKRLGKQTKQ